jgi:GNAT superfamily N-acetyltransferase
MLRDVAPGTPAFEAFTAGLRAANLPTEDLLAEPFRYLCLDDVAWGGAGVGRDALMRSVVVNAQARGKGYGVAIVHALAERAKQSGVERLWLLTTDSAQFFGRLGWRVAERSAAPPAIAASRQFSDLCPASSALMVRSL